MLFCLLAILPFFGSQTVRAQRGPNRIAFTSFRSGINEIYLLTLGTKPVRLAVGSSPAWSPDGLRIAYVNSSQIFVMDDDGRNSARLTNVRTQAADPAWSPDGKKIAFTSFDDGRDEIYVMDSDGTNSTRLTTEYGHSPAWSPDGKSIAFVRAGEIYIMNADSSNATRITNNHANITGAETDHISWSPDGQALVFSFFISEHDAIYRIGSNGARLTRLTEPGDLYARYPCYSPDGNRIVYSVYNTANEDLYVMNSDGSNPVRVTNGYTAYQPAWAPG